MREGYAKKGGRGTPVARAYKRNDVFSNWMPSISSPTAKEAIFRATASQPRLQRCGLMAVMRIKSRVHGVYRHDEHLSLAGIGTNLGPESRSVPLSTAIIQNWLQQQNCTVPLELRYTARYAVN